MPRPEAAQAAYMFSPDMKFLQKVAISHPSEERFLAIRRSPLLHNRPEKWDLPGGNVSFGERHDESLRREIKEETTLDVGEITPTQVVTNYDEATKVYYLFIGYIAKALSADVQLSEEHTEYKWVTKGEFMGLESADFLQDFVESVPSKE